MLGRRLLGRTRPVERGGTGQPAPPCVVPDIGYNWMNEGVGLREATELLHETGCRLGTVRRVYSRRVARRLVISQAPGPNEVLPSGGAVDLVVSRGRRRSRDD